MEPKQLTCMDEELCIEIAKPKDETQDLIITVSVTRTYLVADTLEIARKNGDESSAFSDAHLLLSFVM